MKMPRLIQTGEHERSRSREEKVSSFARAISSAMRNKEEALNRGPLPIFSLIQIQIKNMLLCFTVNFSQDIVFLWIRHF